MTSEKKMPGYGFRSFAGFLKVWKSLNWEERKKWVRDMPPEKMSLCGTKSPFEGIPAAHFMIREFGGEGLVPKRLFTREIMELADRSGVPGAHLLMEHSRIMQEYPDVVPEGIGDMMASAGLLLTRDPSTGKTLAHLCAENRCLPESGITPELLGERDSQGITVAHALGYAGDLPKKFQTKEFLFLADDNGKTVLHSMAAGYCLGEELITKKTVTFADRDGCTIAHVLAQTGKLDRKWVTKEILSLSWLGKTVAHCLAESGSFPPDLMTAEILKLFDKKRVTVAHRLARLGYLPEEFFIPEILDLETLDGKSVLSEAIAGGKFPPHFPSPDILDRVVYVEGMDEPVKVTDAFSWRLMHNSTSAGSTPEAWREYIRKAMISTPFPSLVAVRDYLREGISKKFRVWSVADAIRKEMDMLIVERIMEEEGDIILDSDDDNGMDYCFKN